MKALRNVVKEVLFQFKLRGGLGPRLLFVLTYYSLYLFHRCLLDSRDESRLAALASLARRGLSSRRVLIHWGDNLRLELNLEAASFMPREFLEDRMYEEFSGFAPQPGQIVIDVGAHQGLFAARAAQRVGPSGKVVAIEAHPGNAKILSGNISRNGLSNIELIQAAAAGNDGLATLYMATVVSGGHSLAFRSEIKEGDRASITVVARKLDNILSELKIEKPSLLKIDVEGAALAVFDGATHTLSQRPKIVMEIEGGPDAMKAARLRLERSGYRVRCSRSIIYAEPATSL